MKTIEATEGKWLTNATAKDKVYVKSVYVEENNTDWIECDRPVELSPEEQSRINAEIAELEAELASTDYISFKAYEGQDVSEYGNWKERRQAIRERINELQLNS